MKKTVRPNGDNPAMQGEGNYTAARGHRQSVKVFFDRGAVDQAARDAKPKSPKAQKPKSPEEEAEMKKWCRKSQQRDQWKLRASSRAEEGLASRRF